LSRACLGRKMHFVYEWLKKTVFRVRRYGGEAAGTAEDGSSSGTEPMGAAEGVSIPLGGEENGLFEPFRHKNDLFTKTGSGQT
jgi:hypothetical protein